MQRTIINLMTIVVGILCGMVLAAGGIAVAAALSGETTVVEREHSPVEWRIRVVDTDGEPVPGVDLVLVAIKASELNTDLREKHHDTGLLTDADGVVTLRLEEPLSYAAETRRLWGYVKYPVQLSAVLRYGGRDFAEIPLDYGASGSMEIIIPRDILGPDGE